MRDNFVLFAKIPVSNAFKRTTMTLILYDGTKRQQHVVLYEYFSTIFSSGIDFRAS